MDFDKFIKVSFRYWDNYLRRIGKLSSQGEVVGPAAAQILYPSILLCTKACGFFVAELVGACGAYEGLKLKRHREPSIERYLNQFNTGHEKYILRLHGSNIKLRGLRFALTTDVRYLKDRFPFAEDFRYGLISHHEGRNAFSFADDFKSVRIDECLLVNRYLNAVRVKHILRLMVVRKTVSANEYERLLSEPYQYQANEVLGVFNCPSEKVRDHIIAGQFANIFLLNRLRETTIGEFLKQHPEFLRRALGTKNFIYEPYLPWQEGAQGKSDKAINPDMMIERPDGYFDIYDLKTAVLDRKSITKGEWRRRRFIDYVEEGIAQLAHYAEYFQYPENCRFAYDEYKIKVQDPKLILVVGNFENANKDEISEASRRLSNISIIDYDTLMQLFLMSQRANS